MGKTNLAQRTGRPGQFGWQPYSCLELALNSPNVSDPIHPFFVLTTLRTIFRYCTSPKWAVSPLMYS